MGYQPPRMNISGEIVLPNGASFYQDLSGDRTFDGVFESKNLAEWRYKWFCFIYHHLAVGTRQEFLARAWSAANKAQNKIVNRNYPIERREQISLTHYRYGKTVVSALEALTFNEPLTVDEYRCLQRAFI